LADDIPYPLRTPEAAKFLGLSASALEKMRVRGDGPPYTRVGKRVVVYDVAELDRWFAARKRRLTVKRR